MSRLEPRTVDWTISLSTKKAYNMATQRFAVTELFMPGSVSGEVLGVIEFSQRDETINEVSVDGFNFVDNCSGDSVTLVPDDEQRAADIATDLVMAKFDPAASDAEGRVEYSAADATADNIGKMS